MIKLNFYDDDDNVIKTYQRENIRWKDWKEAYNFYDFNYDNLLDEKNIKQMELMVCKFFGDQFTVGELEEKASYKEVMEIIPQIVSKVFELMQMQGVEFPKVEAVME